MALNTQNALILGPAALHNNISVTALSASTGLILDGATERLGYIYWPGTTSPITELDFNLVLAGTSPTFRAGVFANLAASGRLPDDATQLGGYTSDWTLGATGWRGIVALGSNTGNLTVNTPVWIVIEYVSGTINAGNSIQMRHLNNTAAIIPNRDLQRHYNGTNWTGTAAQSNLPLFVVKHADNTYGGLPITAALARTIRADIYVNGGTVQTQGVRFRAATRVRLLGVCYFMTKSGTPNDLVWTVYEGDTSRYSETEVNTQVISATKAICWFSSPVLLNANQDLFILATQTGTSDSNDYDLQAFTIESAYIDALLPAGMRFVYGNGTTPSSLSVSANEVAWCWPVIADPEADLAMNPFSLFRSSVLAGAMR